MLFLRDAIDDAPKIMQYMAVYLNCAQDCPTCMHSFHLRLFPRL